MFVEYTSLECIRCTETERILKQEWEGEREWGQETTTSQNLKVYSTIEMFPSTQKGIS